MILSPSEIRALEAGAFAEGVSPEALMEEAGAGIAAVVQQFEPRPGRCCAVFGKGNNGGDALVAARRLAEAGWETHLVPAFAAEHWSALTAKKFGEAGRGQHHAPGALPELDGAPLVLLDGLLGTGAAAGLRSPLKELTRAMNALRERSAARVIAIDLPTGFNGEDGLADPDCIIADITVAIACAKPGLLADGAARHVGRLAVVPLKALTERFAPTASGVAIATAHTLQGLLRRRSHEAHKGDFGRIGILAGSRGLTGAARLTAEACVRAGAGLVTLHVLEEAYPIVAAAAPPEVMVRPIRSCREVLDVRSDVLAIGPGLGMDHPAEVLALIRDATQPMIVDADALNILATDLSALDDAAGPRLLTPHPGEMSRLAPKNGGQTRVELVQHWTKSHPGVLLLKGSRTLIGESDRPPSYNTTGHAGMATGGMGDTLTGVCAALAGHGLSLYDAARLGAWLCGRAAERCISHTSESEESTTPTTMLNQLGSAFRDLRARAW